MRADGRPAAMALVTVLALAACTATPQESEGPEAPTAVESLWSSRTDYVGDNSKVAALAGEVGFASLGGVSISLQTAQEPYGVTVELQDADEPLDEAVVRGPAVLLLGLVGNLGEVSVTAGEHVYSFTATSVSDDLGYDVKSLGEDQDRLAAYLETAGGEG